MRWFSQIPRAVAGLALAACSQAPDTTNPGMGTSVGVVEGDLGGRRIFPADNPWNTDISSMPVDPNSSTLIASCGASSELHPDFGTTYNGAPNGIPYVVVDSTVPAATVTFQYADESDSGPYPLPSNTPIEGGSASMGDRHVLVVDISHWRLSELWDTYPPSRSVDHWTAGSGAVFDMSSDSLRPAGWTSADAAGLPILPGLVRYDEVVTHGSLTHALRFTCPSTRNGYVYPARHSAGSANTSLPPMGMRVRLKASVDISTYPAHVQIILGALQHYGMFLADNGSAFYLSGAPDSAWSDDELHTMTQLHGSDFEVVQMGTVVTQ